MILTSYESIIYMGLIDLDATIFVQIILFLCFMIVMTKLILKPYTKMLIERENRTTGLHNQAKELTSKIEEMAKQYEKQISLARQESILIRNNIREDGIQMKEKLLKNVQEESNLLYVKHTEQLKKIKENFNQNMGQYAEILSNEIVNMMIKSYQGEK